jgi:hypothetical protein
VFLVKKAYELKEISLVQQAFITEYPNDGTPSYSVIKNILPYFVKYALIEQVSPDQGFSTFVPRPDFFFRQKIQNTLPQTKNI